MSIKVLYDYTSQLCAGPISLNECSNAMAVQSFGTCLSLINA
jgi:hypothetical protein